MSSGELAGSARDAETSLAKYFRWAKTWNCILLFRNVDLIFPRETGTGDIENHPLMNVLIDALDRFTGIIFLTSNHELGIRYGSLYIRLSTDLHLMPLSKEVTRHIWSTLLRQAEKDGICCKIDQIMDFADEIYQKLVFSGRQIRNLFNTAVHLAELEYQTSDQVVTLDVRHIKQAQNLRR